MRISPATIRSVAWQRFGQEFSWAEADRISEIAQIATRKEIEAVTLTNDSAWSQYIGDLLRLRKSAEALRLASEQIQEVVDTHNYHDTLEEA